ncbi:alpha/beta fold hydrolase [Nesterenkonia muleiensis]|uniref:alpha/beta fold hydrolase n=1 Tax=Nesterenkonia muleiensis TaxID=2282648 RepID=UPI001EE466FD|nr:alpha/beta fold hydrolase [Nesterenkonia muleiensis]
MGEYSSLVLTTSDVAGSRFSLESAVEALHSRILQTGAGSVVMVGLSVGAMMATRYAAAYPDAVAGLLLSGSQVRPNPVMMGVQRAIMGLLPARMLPLPEDLNKRQFLEVLDAAGKADLRDDLAQITVPTLVLCGSRDLANIPAAKTIAAALPDAELRIIAGGGHELNTGAPEDFAHAVEDLLART